MNFLGIDTTRKSARIFLYKDETPYILAVDKNVKHSESLFLYLEKALFETKSELKDFDYFCGIVGPGSFTGIRVGMSVIKGFNKVFNRQIVSVNAFEIVKDYIKNGVILLNSTSTTCYYSVIKSKQIIETGVIEKNKIEEMFREFDIYVLAEEQNELFLEYSNIRTIDNIDDMYFDIVLNKINNKDFENFEPFYLQLSQAERNLKDVDKNN